MSDLSAHGCTGRVSVILVPTARETPITKRFACYVLHLKMLQHEVNLIEVATKEEQLRCINLTWLSLKSKASKSVEQVGGEALNPNMLTNDPIFAHHQELSRFAAAAMR